MAILNYTTKVKSEKTASEIQTILGKGGARAVMSEFENGEVSAIAFQLEISGQILSFRLPINIEGVHRAIKRDCDDRRYRSKEQAARTAWRILKDWVEAQLALVDSNQADLAEVFLPHLQDGTGQTIYQKLKSGGFKALTYEN